jgi:hypothetical protein
MRCGVGIPKNIDYEIKESDPSSGLVITIELKFFAQAKMRKWYY